MDEDLSVNSVPPEMVDAVWQSIEPMVRRGMRHGAGDTISSEALRQDIKAGSKLLWAVHDGSEIIAVLVLEVVQYPATRVLVVVLIAGRDFQRWAPQVQGLLKDYKALIGADSIRSISRVGMRKWMEPMGWKVKALMMELSDGR